MHRVLVTGANGFIGRHLCQRLQDDGCMVRAFLRRDSEGPWHESMLGDMEHLPQGLLDGIETVFHLAGKVHALEGSWQDDEEQFRVNAGGTRRLVRLADAAGVRRFVYFSSLSVMSPTRRGECLDEYGPFACQNIYGLSKLYAEKQYVFSGNHIPHVSVLRPAMVYGVHCKGNLMRMSDVVQSGYFPPLPYDGGKRSMVHVDDVVEAAMLIATHPQADGEAFIVTDGHDYTTRQIYDWMRECMGLHAVSWAVPLLLLRMAGWLGDMIGLLRGRKFLFDSKTLQKLLGGASYSSKKIETLLGFQAKHALQESLPEMIRAHHQSE